jgi:hypothetical protein
VGNTSPELTDSLLRELIGGAMVKMGLSHSHNENPVYRVQQCGKFAFLEMRTCLDAANVLNLNGLPLLGHNLHIVRTTKYDGGCGIEAYMQWDELYRLWTAGDLRLMTAGTPTRVLLISNIASPVAMLDSNFLAALTADIRRDCSSFGVVRSVVAPHNSAIAHVFVEMDSNAQSVNTLLALKVSSQTKRL